MDVNNKRRDMDQRLSFQSLMGLVHNFIGGTSHAPGQLNLGEMKAPKEAQTTRNFQTATFLVPPSPMPKNFPSTPDQIWDRWQKPKYSLLWDGREVLESICKDSDATDAAESSLTSTAITLNLPVQFTVPAAILKHFSCLVISPRVIFALLSHKMSHSSLLGPLTPSYMWMG